MKQKNEVVQSVPLTGHDVITSEDVSRVVHGDKQALIEQLARAKPVALEQLEARKKAEANGLNTTTMKSKEELEREIMQKEAELNMALASMSSVTTEQKQKIHQFDNTSNVGVQTLSNQSPNKLGTVSKNNNIYNGQINNSNMPNNINQNVNTNQVPNTNAVSNTTSNSVNNKLTRKQLKEQKQLLKEQRKKQKQLMKEERRKNSNLKYYMTLFLFIAIFAMVYFLPNISSYFSKLKSERELANSAVITTGTLECNLKKYDKKFDYLYESIFTYKDNMLLKLSYKVTTKGDQTIDADVVILGAGAAGLSAALEASNAGASVVVLEKQGIVGGSTTRSGGKLVAAGTKQQEEAGFTGDTAEDLYNYLSSFDTYHEIDADKLHEFTDHALEDVQWLEGLGVDVINVEPIHSSITPWRVLNTKGGGGQVSGIGGQITVPLYDAVAKTNTQFIYN